MSSPPPIPSLPPRLPVSPPRKGSSTPWIPIVVVVSVLGFFGFRIFQMWPVISKGMTEKRGWAPGYEELGDAEAKVVSNQGGAAHGNTPEAIELSATVSKRMQLLRETLFEKGKKKEEQWLTEGNFIVFCQIKKETCAFILHVPELRRFTAEAQQSLIELSYLTACEALDELPETAPRRLAVATKGAMLFDRMMIGDYNPNAAKPLASATGKKLSGMTQDAKELFPFFAPE